MRILVVDDHKEFRDEVLGILRRNGHQAEGATSADAAIPLAQSGDYDFVFVDFNMPGHDGVWFMENVRLPRGTKALLVTAHVYREMINRMFRLGVSGYIIKPFEEADLLRQLAVLLPPTRVSGGETADPATRQAQTLDRTGQVHDQNGRESKPRTVGRPGVNR